MKRKCPSCGQPVFVRTGADGLRHLLREADVEAHVGYFPVLEVAGESHYQRTLERIAGGRTPHGPRNTEHIAALIPDPANAHDTNAVRVVVMPVRSAANPTLQRGQAWGLVGYLTRKDAVAYRPVIDAAAAVGAVIGCMAELTGGWDRGTGDRGFFGVILHLGLPRDCEAEAARRSRPFP